ncbi:4-hydroxy-L-threonine phosphate dehydrogenase PdxA [Bradyrhizobium sp. LB7.2]
MTAKPLIALAMGDPAGISPELTARLVVQDDIRACSRIVVVGDRRIFDQGARIAGVKPELKTMEQGADFRAAKGETLFVESRPPRSQRRPAGSCQPCRRQVRACQLQARARTRPRQPRRCRLLHPVQQAGDAARPRRV